MSEHIISNLSSKIWNMGDSSASTSISGIVIVAQWDGSAIEYQLVSGIFGYSTSDPYAAIRALNNALYA
jgi:hypothetical protein